eukprot:GHVH01010973.1.p1 GENE.GHVH01010973.1~~GHVH01010973.1.p1  ORF type:complete len:173 (+),score=17.08 GHVH01010973.1:109-627(+)
MSNIIACDPNTSFFGFMGIATAMIFSNLGASYGTAKSGVGLCSMGVMRPELVMKGVIPGVMAQILAIYGLIISMIIFQKITPANAYSAYMGYSHLAAGLTTGLCSLGAGLAIGVVGDAGVRAIAQQSRLFVGMMLVLIFAEALGLYGMIIGIVIAMPTPADLCTPYSSASSS